MFPFYESTSEWDDFGEIINPDDYVIKDQDMDQASMQASIHLDIFNFEFDHCAHLHCLLLQVVGDMEGKLDEAAASLILDTKPSKVISNELTVSITFFS